MNVRSTVRSMICLAGLLLCTGCYWKSPSAPSVNRAPQPGPIITPPEPAKREWSQPTASETQALSSSSPDSETPPMPIVPPAEPAVLAIESVPVPAPAPTEPTAQEGELFRDTFADVQGSIYWNRDGTKSKEGLLNLRTVYFFHGKPDGGPLVMRVLEDHTQYGPDGQPGVLSLTWLQLPPMLSYSGFCYLGPRTQRLPLPELAAARTADDLAPYRLQFRHRVINERTSAYSLTVGCRIEPMLADSYAKRLDLNAFTATGKWGTFDLPLTEGTNAEGFLKAIAEENPTSFKIIWSQAGPYADYHSGDTLLIDDIILSAAQAPRTE